MTMIIKRAVMLMTLISCLASLPSSAQQVGKLGDPAPPITAMEWTKGQPVKLKSGTNTDVLVFRSLTRANDFALTNLSLLQERYRNKGIVVVAISDDPPDQLKTFVEAKGAEIDFTVAADEVPSRTARNFLHNFGQILLPRAFIVNPDGKVIWYGHPLTEGMGEVVDEIAAGRYNLQQSQKDVVDTEEMDQYLALAHQGDEHAIKAGRVLLAIRTNDAPGLCTLASKIATDPYIQKRDFDLAAAALDRAEQLSATNATDIAVDRAILLFQAGKEVEGLAAAKKALAAAPNPDAREEAEICVHAMESRLAAKASQPATPTTSSATNGMISTPAKTNQVADATSQH
jgi:peroxiredoxin